MSKFPALLLSLSIGSLISAFSVISTPLFAQTAGHLTFERWTGLPSSVSVNTLKEAGISQRPADISELLVGAATAQGLGDNYGARLRGTVTAPVTGNYTFFISSDDGGELWLSETSSGMDKKRIAHHTGWTGFNIWNKYSSQRSRSISLQAGQQYYIEGLMQEAGGGDHLSIGWAYEATFSDFSALPLTATEIIPAAQLTSFVADSLDADGDNLPDAWQAQFPIAGTAFEQSEFGDPDGDLLTNLEESQLGTDPTTPTSIAGSLTEEVWTGVPGMDLKDFYEHPKYVQESDYRGLVHQSEGTRWLGDYTATKIRGYIEAPVSGDYYFWVSGDDEVRFWMSDSEDKFSKKLLVAPHLYVGYRQYDIELSQKSKVMTLIEGQKYYIELQHKENRGGGNSPVSMVWQAPGGERELVPVEYLHTYVRNANDKDDDDLLDDWELANGLDSSEKGDGNSGDGYFGDMDGDGLLNHEEYTSGTRADLADTDGDGVNDLVEINLFEADAIAAEVAPFQSVMTVDGSNYTASYGGWAKSDSIAYSTGVRGWVEYEITAPVSGVYLLDLTMAPYSGGTLSDEYELTFSLDGNYVARADTTIVNKSTGQVKTLTPWIQAGTHTVRIFNDNSLTYRKVSFNGLEMLSAQGEDNNSNGTPDWVEARLVRLNGVDTRETESRVSPLGVEGRARYPELMSISGGVSVQPSAGERWIANVELDPQSPVALHITFENDGLVQNQQIKWVETNLLAEQQIQLRSGDSMLLTAYEGDSGSEAEQVALSIDGQTYTFEANDPQQYCFDTAGTYTIGVTWSNGNQSEQNSVTVTVVEPVTLVNPVCVVDHVREWDLPALPEGAVLEIDERIEVRDALPLGDGAMRYLIKSDSPENRYAHIRLGEDGPILQTIALRGLTVRDAGETSMTFVEDFEDGSYQVDMPSIVSSVYEDVRVNYDIFIGGVIFDTGGISKDFVASDFDDLGQAIVSFIKTGTAGSACHRTGVWQGTKRIAWFY